MWNVSSRLFRFHSTALKGLPRLSGLRKGLILGMILLSSTSDLFAQPAKKPTVEDRELLTKDDFKIKISYFKSLSGPDAPVVILLHGKRGTRLQWKGLATELQQKADFAVITVDLRGHGESPLPKKGELRKADYQAMVAFDLEAVKDFILEEHLKKHLNMNKLGIVACDFSAAVAVLYTELDWEKLPYDELPTEEGRTPRGQDVQALALISPDATVPGLSINKALPVVRALKRPVMIAVSEKNAADVAAANKVFDQLVSKKDREKDEKDPPYLWKYEENFSGMDLVTRNPNVRNHIFAFLTKYVKEHQSNWRDRRSQLERD